MNDKLKEILDIPQHLRRDAVTDEVQAMLNAANVMEAQSALITKLQQELAESNDAMSQAQWRFEQAEAQLDAVREFIQQNDDWKMTTKDVVKNIKQHSEKGWEKYRELRKEVAKDKYPSLTNDVILDIANFHKCEWKERALKAEAQLDAVRGITKRVSSELSTDGQIAFNNGWNALRGEILAALNGKGK